MLVLAVSPRSPQPLLERRVAIQVLALSRHLAEAEAVAAVPRQEVPVATGVVPPGVMQADVVPEPWAKAIAVVVDRVPEWKAIMPVVAVVAPEFLDRMPRKQVQQLQGLGAQVAPLPFLAS